MKKYYLYALLLLFAAMFLPLQANGVQQPVDVVYLDGVINPAMGDYIIRGIKQAEKDGAILIIQIDTPGGLDGPMRKIAQQIMAADIPVIAYVGPSGARAASAGVFVAYSSNLIAMAHGTNMGAAHPIFMSPFGSSGGGPQEKIMSEKATNDMVASIRSISIKRGRDSNWAEDAVRKSVSISSQIAFEKKIIDIMADDISALLLQIKGKKVPVGKREVTLNPQLGEVKKINMTTTEKFLFTITDPTIAFILFLLGLLGLYYELSNPGLILPGVVGGISLILALYAFGTLPINYAGVFLLVFSFVLFIADIYAPTHGFLTAGGIISLVLGGFMLIPAGPANLSVSPWAIFGAAAILGGFFLVMIFFLLSTFKIKSISGKQGMMGAIGTVTKELNPEGMVMVEGELWKARSNAGAIAKGEKVKILKVQNLKILVEKAPQDSDFSSEAK